MSRESFGAHSCGRLRTEGFLAPFAEKMTRVGAKVALLRVCVQREIACVRERERASERASESESESESERERARERESARERAGARARKRASEQASEREKER